MNSKTLILLTTLAAMTAACSQDTVLSDVPQPLSVTTDGTQQQADADELSLECAVGGADTRTGIDVQTSTFSSGNTVRVWLKHFKKKPDGGVLTAVDANYEQFDCTVASNGKNLTLPSGYTYTYSGAGNYPEAYGIKPNTFTGGTFTVQTDQSTSTNYLASDLVYSPRKTYPQSSGTMTLQFQHLMSKIVVRLVKAENSGLEDTDLSTATVTVNAQTTCTFNYPEADYVTLPTTDSYTNITLLPDEAQSAADTYAGACIIPPQGYVAGHDFITVHLNGTGGKEYTQVIPTGDGGIGKTFEGGKQYTYTFTVKDEGWELEVQSITISDWGSEETLTQGSDYYGDGYL